MAVTGPALREMSVYELDQGYYGWRTETASTTTQAPDYWSPAGLNKFWLYPRVGATQTFELLVYRNPAVLTATTDYIDIDEGQLTKVLGLAQAILAFKQGIPEGTDNSKALRDLVLSAAEGRNKELTKTALYKNYMGHAEEVGEPGTPKGQKGVRG